ncbi:3-methyl-2-oxobutanoate hydroxymethyltransferase [Alkalicoccus halolimnae]|uniref:3-methyl-2-oxobutanoate hydroxymethyltransferase n=1 Tax=Alkalicoccus halolimnae TaxID=1667239 RepID=A0A5C7F0Q3_9BACI|nr:3-methyl-2-oxobutanoate hydroxymethyltransferase [Alkalicoccus halolimnae]TXF82979.1 3-methyl-2-oxobutanoate hydroxymethyltransferase [Alkalicoccus halolimnae]
MKKTTVDFKQMKENHKPIVMVTAYDAPAASLSEAAGVDTILVGDSLGMVVLGYDSTVPVSMEDMIHHTKAVKRGARSTFIVTDMPFMSYHVSKMDTMINARRIIQESGADAVKLEGNGEVFDYTAALVKAGVPVVSHLGLTPQTVGVSGGYKVKGKTAEEQKQLVEDAGRAEKAGACMLVLECVPEEAAKRIQETVTIPVIGIGAGRFTDGQVLVYHDIVGYYGGHKPKFVKQYTDIQAPVQKAIEEYANEVRSHKFPQEGHVFSPLEKTEGLYGGSK